MFLILIVTMNIISRISHTKRQKFLLGCSLSSINNKQLYFFDQLRNVNMKFACCICEKTVADDHNTICCDIYNKWVHISCNNISRYCFRKFQKSSTPWYCENCLKQVLPFNKRTDYQLKVLVLGKVLTSPKLLFFNFLFIYLFQMKNVKMQPKLN